VTAAVEAANAALYTPVETRDLDHMDAEEPGALVCVHPGWPMLRGRAEVLRSWSAVMAGTAYIQFLLTDVHVSLVGDAAIVTCTENVLTSADVGENAAVVATNVFVRRRDGWRLVVHHGSPVLGRLSHE
jgi:ketosteroid isomerase-like protein